MTDIQGPAVQDGSSPSDTPTWINSDEDGGGSEEYRTILEIWTEVLKPVEELRTQKVMPQWATRIITQYPEITFKDMPSYRDEYYACVVVLQQILAEEISTDDECLKRISAEEDAQLNGILYRNILTRWQKEFLHWELEWDCTSNRASIQLAAIAEVHKMFFDSTGLISLLDQIDLVFTDADREALAAELQEIKDAADAG